MLILAFETSAKAASVALMHDGKLLGESYQNTGLTHSQTLLPMAAGLLEQCGLKPQDLDLIAVAAGPGSFTGLRIGVAAAKGLAWARMLDGKVTSSYQKFLTDEENAAAKAKAESDAAAVLAHRISGRSNPMGSVQHTNNQKRNHPNGWFLFW